MKRIVFLGLLTLIVAFPLAFAHAAEIYWDGMPADEEIADTDFKHKYGEPNTTKSMGDLGIYDNNMVINVEGPDDAPAPDYEAPTPAPIQPRSVETPSTPTVAPRQRDTAPRATEQERGSGANIMRRLERAPKPQPQTVEPQPGPPVPASSDEPASSGEKKMKWGQESSSSSDTKTKFQWGEKK
jgi:hypothetical protein